MVQTLAEAARRLQTAQQRWIIVAIMADGATKLPPAPVVLLRDYCRTDRTAHATKMARQARVSRQAVWVAVGGAMPPRWQLAGLHVPSWRQHQPLAPLRLMVRGGRLGLSFAVHNQRAMARARQESALALVSPIFPTQSHPGAQPLGVVRLGLWLRQRGVAPVLALGGVNSQTLKTLETRRRLSHLRGSAAIRGWHLES